MLDVEQQIIVAYFNFFFSKLNSLLPLLSIYLCFSLIWTLIHSSSLEHNYKEFQNHMFSTRTNWNTAHQETTRKKEILLIFFHLSGLFSYLHERDCYAVFFFSGVRKNDYYRSIACADADPSVKFINIHTYMRVREKLWSHRSDLFEKRKRKNKYVEYAQHTVGGYLLRIFVWFDLVLHEKLYAMFTQRSYINSGNIDFSFIQQRIIRGYVSVIHCKCQRDIRTHTHTLLIG